MFFAPSNGCCDCGLPDVFKEVCHIHKIKQESGGVDVTKDCNIVILKFVIFVLTSIFSNGSGKILPDIFTVEGTETNDIFRTAQTTLLNPYMEVP
eukprot:UN05680